VPLVTYLGNGLHNIINIEDISKRQNNLLGQVTHDFLDLFMALFQGVQRWDITGAEFLCPVEDGFFLWIRKG
jgi:hypothetical protein